MKKIFFNKRKKNYKIINYSYILFIFFIVFVLAYFFLNYKSFSSKVNLIVQKYSNEYNYNLSNITISKLKYVEKNEILKYFEPHMKSSIFFIPIKDIAHEIKKNHWIKNFKITNDYKNTVNIFIEEEIPIGVYDNLNQKLLFSENLVILGVVKNYKKYQDLIIFYGENSVYNSKKLLKDLSELIKEDIISAEFIKNRRWNLVLKNSIVLKLPEENILDSLEKYKEIYKNLSNKDLKYIKSIDLRIKNQAIIKYIN